MRDDEKLSSSSTARIFEKNVLGTRLQPCCTTLNTGFYRDGHCRTGHQDFGSHVICAVVTQEFLDFSRSQGNDLITPIPGYKFPGLAPGNSWCLCATRWRDAFNEGVAPRVKLESTHERALRFVTLDTLKSHSITLM